MRVLDFLFFLFRTFLINLLPTKFVRLLFKCNYVFIANLPNFDVIPQNKFFIYFRRFFKLMHPLLIAPITGLKDREGREKIGWTVICFLTANDIIHNIRLAKKRVFSAVRLSEKIGAKIVSLGAFTSIAVRDGFDLVDKVGVGITTGNTYSAVIAVQNLERAAKIKELDLLHSVVAVVGSGGSVGSGCARYLIGKVKKLILVDLNLKGLQDSFREVEKTSSSEIILSADIDLIREADSIIVVTSAIKGIVEERHLKRGAIVVDGAHPPNVSKETISQRKDVLVISSAIVRAPGINTNFNLGVGKEEVHGCLAEALILSWLGKENSYILGKVGKNDMDEIAGIANLIGFQPASFRNSLGCIVF